ncbi:MAG: hypothetical protein M0R18_13915 [Deltaproteobacteria bacterium]|jgi:hypothetical protein|nr:hypothetical protein [Deltaproteobacteria bacterium]
MDIRRMNNVNIEQQAGQGLSYAFSLPSLPLLRRQRADRGNHLIVSAFSGPDNSICFPVG